MRGGSGRRKDQGLEGAALYSLGDWCSGAPSQRAGRMEVAATPANSPQPPRRLTCSGGRSRAREPSTQWSTPAGERHSLRTATVALLCPGCSGASQPAAREPCPAEPT